MTQECKYFLSAFLMLIFIPPLAAQMSLQDRQDALTGLDGSAEEAIAAVDLIREKVARPLDSVEPRAETDVKFVKDALLPKLASRVQQEEDPNALNKLLRFVAGIGQRFGESDPNISDTVEAILAQNLLREDVNEYTKLDGLQRLANTKRLNEATLTMVATFAETQSGSFLKESAIRCLSKEYPFQSLARSKMHEYLVDTDAAIRRGAVASIVYMGAIPEELQSKVEALLTDKDREVRLAAVTTVGIQTAYEDAIPHTLLDTLTEMAMNRAEDPIVSQSAASAISKIAHFHGESAYVDALKRIAMNQRTAVPVRHMALRVLPFATNYSQELYVFLDEISAQSSPELDTALKDALRFLSKRTSRPASKE